MLHALVVAILLLASTIACAQTSTSSPRPQLDSELARATDVGQLLQVANRYVDAGYQQEAKAIVDRAAQKARSSGDWQSIAALYLRLGFADDANSAQRRARNISR